MWKISTKWNDLVEHFYWPQGHPRRSLRPSPPPLLHPSPRRRQRAKPLPSGSGISSYGPFLRWETSPKRSVGPRHWLHVWRCLDFRAEASGWWWPVFRWLHRGNRREGWVLFLCRLKWQEFCIDFFEVIDLDIIYTQYCFLWNYLNLKILILILLEYRNPWSSGSIYFLCVVPIPYPSSHE